MRVLLGVVVGIVLVRLAQSRRVREDARRRLTTAPETLRQAATSVKAASAGQTERMARAFDATPLSQTLKDTLRRARKAPRSTTEPE
jgi:hypothetical protein